MSQSSDRHGSSTTLASTHADILGCTPAIAAVSR